MKTGEKLLRIYQLLFDSFGPQHWWPGETPFEVMVGAVLTQNTSWHNVAKAIGNLKDNDLLTPAALYALPAEVLAAHIRPAGYFNLKAGRLRNMLRLIVEDYDGDLDQLLAQETGRLRELLLSVRGIGPETADSICLYAANKPLFVVDAYTHRLLHRHGLVPEECDYEEMQQLFMDHLTADSRLFNEYHALIVRLGKDYCRKGNPRCASCPLREITPVLMDPRP
ncbi:MAG: endonuclease [Desulfobulbaceae bacterium A2]|nr:MAG: endonuclease [Desulfobulbaceae bacterium A2]